MTTKGTPARPHVPGTVGAALLASGFPFQTAVSNLIGEISGWKIITEEFPWQDASGRDHFLDLIATDGTWAVAVECKKTEKEIFTFLNPKTDRPTPESDTVRCTYTSQIQDSTRRLEVFCGEWLALPLSHEVIYCVVSTSKSGGDQRLLEPDAQKLIRGADAFARERRVRFRPAEANERDTPILPILVTNAALFVASYDPQTVSLQTGQLPAAPEAITPVQWVRFRKAFLAPEGGVDLGDRTVMVVSANALSELLAQLEIVRAVPQGKAFHLPFAGRR